MSSGSKRSALFWNRWGLLFGLLDQLEFFGQECGDPLALLVPGNRLDRDDGDAPHAGVYVDAADRVVDPESLGENASELVPSKFSIIGIDIEIVAHSVAPFAKKSSGMPNARQIA